MNRTTIDVRGVWLSPLIEGNEAGPWVTFAHSLATDLTLFDEQAGALAERYRILRFDMRGHGRSAAPPRPYALADLVGDADGPHPEEMRALAALVPGARLVEIGPAGHLSNLKQPGAFNQALAGFLDGVEGRG